MFSVFLRRIILVYAGLRSLFSGLFAGIFLIFEKPYLRIPFYMFLTLFVLWAMGFAAFYNSIEQSWDEITENNPEISNKVDAIIVLTGGSERIRTGFHLLQNNYGKVLFISGVNQQVRLPELFALHNIPKEDFFKMISRVDMGFESSNTIENATEIKNWVKKIGKIKSIKLVTSNYHMKRAMLEISDKLPEVEIYPHPVIPINVRLDKWWKFEGTRGLLINEYNKLIAAYLRIYLEKI